MPAKEWTHSHFFSNEKILQVLNVQCVLQALNALEGKSRGDLFVCFEWDMRAGWLAVEGLRCFFERASRRCEADTRSV